MKETLKTRIAKKKARDLLFQVGYERPDDLDLDELIWFSDGVLKESKLDNSLGRIVFGDKRATITVNSIVSYQPKARFIKAHELGHLLLHKELSRNFFDTDKTLNEWLARGNQELEANTFASELLMPSDVFKSVIANRKIDNTLIEECSNFFGVSKTAFFLKYVEFGEYPIALVYSEKGNIRWVNITEDFVLNYIRVGSRIPYNTVTMDVLKGEAIPNKPEIVDAISWFSDDFEVTKYKNWKFKELCFVTGPGSILTCIWER